MVRHRCVRNTPIEVINNLNKEINAGLADLGGTPLPGSPDQLGKS